MAELTLQEVKDYIQIDFDDEATDRLLCRLMHTADAYLQGAVAKNYPREDERAKQISLCLVADMYEKRGTSAREAANESRLIRDFTQQLQMEMRRVEYDTSNNNTET